MAKLLGVLLVAGALAAVAALVPVGGRTVLDRWDAARTPGEFASRGWAEIAGAAGPHEPSRKAHGKAARKGQPVERVSDADRAALERIVADRAEK